MLRRPFGIVVGLAAVVALVHPGGRSTDEAPTASAVAVATPAPQTANDTVTEHTRASTAARMTKLPLRFEANAGQWDPRVRFVTHGNGTTLFLTDDAMTIALSDTKLPLRKPGTRPDEERKAREEALANAKHAAVKMKLVGVTPSAPAGENELETKSNFFLGNDPTKWRSNVANYGSVRAKNWRPGVDVVWHGGANGLEYDLDVAAGTDASALAMEIEGATSLKVANDGALEIATAAGTLREQPPRVVQAGKDLPTRYRIESATRVGFVIEGYERDQAVLIDPTLLYSTYLGGSGNELSNAGNIAVDASGSVYVSGYADAASFPTTTGAVQASSAGGYDAFVTKLNAAGSALTYSTYLGGSSYEYAEGIAVDASGNAYVTGETTSTNFPTTSGATQTANAGGDDAFVTKLNAAGSALTYSTYLGGSSNDGAAGIAIDVSGSACVTGYTGSTNFPTTGGATQTANAGSDDAFVTKLNAAGSVLTYSTYLGGSSHDYPIGIALDASGNAYVTGETSSTNLPTTGGVTQTADAGNYDAFVTKLNAAGSALTYSTYLGGSSYDVGLGIAVDAGGSAYVTGGTQSTNFPITSGAAQTSFGGSEDVFVTKLNAAGSALAYSTYLGGSSPEEGHGIGLDGNGNAYVTGWANATFPTTADAYQSANAGSGEAFFTRLNASGSKFTYSTYLGGSLYEQGMGIAVDAKGAAYIAGYTGSTNFPTTTGAYQTANGGGGNYDAFIAKFGDPALVLTPTSASVTPLGSKSFSASGGSGSGYTYSLQTNASGGSIDSSGNYQAGTTGSVTDVVLVTDSDNNTATANVTVTAGITITPTTPATTPKGTIDFSGTFGGSNTGFTWSIATNNSGGTMDASTGLYKAGTTGGVTDTVKVKDSLGNTATVNVSVGSGIAINPSSPTPAPKGSISFTATGGDSTHGFTWSLTTNNSGGSVVASSGVYTAGTTGSVTDVVQAIDDLGNTASVNVVVGAGVTIGPSSPSIAPKGAIAFTVSGGSGHGYIWSVSTNKSHGSIDTSGNYTAGTTGSVTDVVTVEDSLGNSASANVTVTASLSISPTTPTTSPKGSVAFTASGGDTTDGYTFSIPSNNSHGTIDASGNYKAGSTPSVTDTIKVVDALGNSATATVTVGAGVSLSPSSASVAPLGAQSFAASGGSGTGFTWAVSTNHSNGSIDASGNYKAGSTGNVADTVTATDSLGNTGSVSISVGGGIAINPSSASTTPKGSLTFSATGGSGSGFTWSVSTNNSHGSIDSSGNYTAGTTGSVTDTIKVVDSLGNTASASVTVGDGVSITASGTSTAPLGTLTFSASGGSGSSFTWSISTNNSNGSIDSSGNYTAGSTGGVTDTIKVTDSLGNTATIMVSITAALAIHPTTASVTPLGSKTFSASGGTGSYTFDLQTNASGGNVSSTSGAYTAGSTGGVTDVVRVTDTNGATATANVSVTAGVSITPAAPSVAPLGGIAFSASGGSGSGYKWAIGPNNSGGSINVSTGAYVAGSTSSVSDTVTVTDSLGNTANASISVGGGLAITPATPSTPPKGSLTFSVSGGSGTGYAWSLATNASGGTIDASSGAYVAGATANVTDIVHVVDSLANAATVNVSVGAGVSVAPHTATVAAGKTLTFTASGGSGTGYAWSIATNASGASIASSGKYTAGATGGVSDIVQLSDSLGNTATASVTVTAPASGDGGVDDGGAGDGESHVVANDGGDAGSNVVPSGILEGDGGCGCRMNGDAASSRRDVGIFLALIALVFVRRRRGAR